MTKSCCACQRVNDVSNNPIYLHGANCFRILCKKHLFATVTVHCLLQEAWARASGNVTVQYFLLIYALSMTNIRYTSFCLEHCHHLRSSEGKGHQGKGQGFSFFDMFVYIFYFPVFFSGPLMTYDQFYLQVSHIQLCVCVHAYVRACV